MPGSYPSISVIILEYYKPNNKFIRCLKSFTNQNYKNFELILIIWGSDDLTYVNDIIQKYKIEKNRIRLFYYRGDPGYAKGNNIGVKQAKYDYILISNPDVETTSDFLSKIINSFRYIEKLNKNDKIIIGPRVCNYNGIIEYSRRNINFLGFSNIDISKTNKIRRSMISCGCSFLIKKKYYNALNGFDEKYFMYHEDIDFSIRATLLGILQYIDNTIILYHLRSDEEFKLIKFKYYYHERNRLMMCFEHSKKKYKMVLINLLFEPFHIIFALLKGFLKVRFRIYHFLIRNLYLITKQSGKENDFFDKYYRIDGIFNEVNSNKLVLVLLNFYSKILFYYYHH